MSEKQAKQKRKEATQPIHTILINLYQNGSITIERLPADPVACCDIMCRAANIAIKHTINESMKDQSIIHVPKIVPPNMGK